MDKREFGVFVTEFRQRFLSPDESFDFVMLWESKIVPFDLDVIRLALADVAGDKQIVKTPSRFYLPLILDYANEQAQRKRHVVEHEQRRKQEVEWKAQNKDGIKGPSIVELVRMKKIGGEK